MYIQDDEPSIDDIRIAVTDAARCKKSRGFRNEDIEDLINETLAIYLLKIAEGEIPPPPNEDGRRWDWRRWVRAAVSFQAANMARRNKIRKHAPLAEAMERAESDEPFWVKEEMKSLRDAINKLDAEDRQLIADRFMRGQTQQELANNRCCSIGRIHAWLRRVLAQIRVNMG